MKILAREVELNAVKSAAMPDALRLEAQKVWELYRQGIIREAYFQSEKHLAVLVLECIDLAEAQSVIRSLPLVEVGLIDFDLIQLIPYDGFERLFGSPLDA